MLSNPFGQARVTRGVCGGGCVNARGNVHCCRAQAVAPVSCDSALETLKQAAGKMKSSGKVAPKAVFDSLRVVQRSKIEGDVDWAVIECDQYWRLVFTAKAEAMKANNSTGSYFPVVATNKFSPSGSGSGKMCTAVYLPHIAAVEFSGMYNIKGKLTNFDMTGLKLKLGPFVLGPISIPSQVKDGKGPFFNFFYADDDIVCAVGRSGGIAMWAKAEPTFIAEKGIFF